mgnify:CR=1 FL=1
MMISGTFIVFSVRGRAYEDLRGQFNHAIGQLRQVVSMETSKDGMEKALREAIINSAYFYKDTQVYLLNSKGETLFSTVSAGKEKPRFTSQTVMSAMNGTQSKEMDRMVEEDEMGNPMNMRGYADAIMMDGEVQFIIYIRSFTKELEENLFNTILIILTAVLLAIGLMGGIGSILASTLTQPIITLTHKARKMAEGDFKQVIMVQSDDEIGQLTVNFNRMAFALDRSLTAMTSEKNKMETVLAHMADGVLAFDRRGDLIHANPLAYQLLQLSSEIVDIGELHKVLDLKIGFEELMDMSEGTIIQQLLQIEDKYINACFAPYLDLNGKTAGIIVVFQDVTEHKKLEEAQKEFVANVSHELRTPLTTIKSYTETLLDGAVEDRDTAYRFLEVVEYETDRMTVLVQDLLELSKLDSRQIQLCKKQISLSALVEGCVQKYEIHMSKKKQKLYFIPPLEEYQILGDPDRILQVLNNILSNAMKYSPEEAEITVSIEECRDHIQVKVIDTGMGIPKEDIGKIFERFYRVDKARSRVMGGTGLGLAIAKEIMELHGGTIELESVYGEGSEVRLVFPKFCGEKK